MAYTTQRNYRVTVSGIPGFWSMFTGGKVEASSTEIFDGGRKMPYQVSGNPKTEKITLKRPFDPDKHGWVPALRKQVGEFRGTITKQPIDGNETPIGDPIVYPNALLVSFQEPEFDAASNDAALLECEFAIEEIV